MFDARSNTPMLLFMRPKKVRFNLFTLRPFFILRQAQDKTLSFCRRVFIISLAFIFLFNSVGGGLFVGESWAAKATAGLPSVGPESAGGPTPLKELNAGTFTIPQDLGYIQEAANVPNSSRTVIHIQDAHCNYAAQKKISQILSYLTTEYGVNAVNCEGGKDNYDLDVFTKIAEKDIREKVSNFFVKEGVVNAAEFFAVNNPNKVKLWGVEDADLYIKNLKVYRESLAYKGEVDKYIKSIGYILDNLKKHIYSPELLDFDNYYMKYKDGQVSFKEYIAYLIMTAHKKVVDIKSFPNIYLLGQTLDEEDKIDFKKANNEKDEVVDKLKKVLSRNELEDLMLKVGHMKIERISQGEFYAYLVKKAKSVNINLKDYPELEKYIVYISIYSAIDRTKIAKEIDSLEDKIKEALYENDTQRELGILSKNLILEKNMFNISLTRDDYSYYVEHQTSFEVSNFVSFIEAKAPLYKIQAKLDSNIDRLDVYREKIEAFYKCSLERDKAFVKNIKFTEHDRPNSIIITGGFHTQNLRELFGKENVSYISIMPKFTNSAGYESPYLKRLAGQRTALENVIDTAIPAVLNLQVVNILSQLAPEVEGKANIERFRLAVLIMTAVERGQQFMLKVSREAYPQESRPQEDKVIVFNRGEGGNISSTTTLSNEPNFARLASVANATLTAINANNFAFNLIAIQPTTQVVAAQPALATSAVQAQPATLNGVPVIKPSYIYDEGRGMKPIHPVTHVPVAIGELNKAMADIIESAKTPNPDRVKLVGAMGEMIATLIANDKSNGPAVISSILSSISDLDRPVKNELIMALRTAVAIKGLGEVRPAGLDVVVQIAPIGQRNGAASANRVIEDKLDRYYNGVIAKSIIGEGVEDADGLARIVSLARNAMEKSPDKLSARTLLLLPESLRGVLPSALDKAGAIQDTRIKIQFVEQGDMPDLVTQFEFGIEILEYVRGGEKPEEASQRLLDLIRAMVDSDKEPREILKNELFKQMIRIRPVNWQNLGEQRKAWEAVAKSL
jgi:hypothetical protein